MDLHLSCARQGSASVSPVPLTIRELNEPKPDTHRHQEGNLIISSINHAAYTLSPSLSLLSSLLPLQLSQARGILIHVPIPAMSQSLFTPSLSFSSFNDTPPSPSRLQTPSPLFRSQQKSAIPTTVTAPPCPPAASRRRSWALPF